MVKKGAPLKPVQDSHQNGKGGGVGGSDGTGEVENVRHFFDTLFLTDPICPCCGKRAGEIDLYWWKYVDRLG